MECRLDTFDGASDGALVFRGSLGSGLEGAVASRRRTMGFRQRHLAMAMLVAGVAASAAEGAMTEDGVGASAAIRDRAEVSASVDRVRGASPSTSRSAGDPDPPAGATRDPAVGAKPPTVAPSSPSAADAPSGGALPGPSEPPKSLDDLLGVPSGSDDSGRSATDAAEREQKRRLERSLDEASMQDLVARAIEGMRSASSRLGEQKDAGLGTQRAQEEVVRTLDRLLEEAQRQQQKKGRSSSSSKPSSRPQQSQDPSERNGRRQQEAARDRTQPSESSARPSDGTSPSDAQREETGGAPGELSESRIEWGRLPERIRELVLQGRRDRVSTIYERLTREYYQRLAEEASR